jgi:hypothetical protein
MGVLKKLGGGLKDSIAGGNDALRGDNVRVGEGRGLGEGMESVETVQAHQQVGQVPHLFRRILSRHVRQRGIFYNSC